MSEWEKIPKYSDYELPDAMDLSPVAEVNRSREEIAKLRAENERLKPLADSTEFLHDGITNLRTREAKLTSLLASAREALEFYSDSFTYMDYIRRSGPSTIEVDDELKQRACNTLTEIDASGLLPAPGKGE